MSRQTSQNAVSDHDHNAKWYMWYAVLSEPLFYGPTLILYLTKFIGVPHAHVFYYEACAVFVLMLWEVITGAFADHVGRKKSIMIGRILLVFYVCLLAAIKAPWQAFFVNLLWALADPFTSGADMSLLHDSYEGADRPKWYKRTLARASEVKFKVHALARCAGGFLFVMNPRLPVIWSVPGYLVVLYVVAQFRERRTAEPYELGMHIGIVKQGVRVLRSSPRLRTLAQAQIWFLVASKMFFFCYNPLFDAIGLPIPMYGVVLGVCSYICGMAARRADDDDGAKPSKSHLTNIVFLHSSLALATLTFVLFKNAWVLLALVPLSAARGRGEVFFNAANNAEFEDDKVRATVNSAIAACYYGCELVVDLLLGFVRTRATLTETVFVLALAYIVVSAWQVRRVKKLFG